MDVVWPFCAGWDRTPKDSDLLKKEVNGFFLKKQNQCELFETYLLCIGYKDDAFNLITSFGYKDAFARVDHR